MKNSYLLLSLLFSLSLSLQLQSQTPILVLPAGHSQQVTCIASSPNGGLTLTGSADNTAKLWEATTGRELFTFRGHGAWIQSLAFSPDANLIATASRDRTVRVWETKTGKFLFALKGHKGWVNSVTFSSDGEKIMTASSDRSIKLWDASNGTLLNTIVPQSLEIWTAAYSPDGNSIAIGSSDRTIKIWDLASNQIITTLTGHQERVFSVAFSPDGQQLISGSFDKTAKIWNLTSKTLIKTLNGHKGSVNDVSFSPDGNKVLTASSDKMAKIWNMTSGKVIKTLEGHSKMIWAACYSKNGASILTASGDRTAKSWDANTGENLLSFAGQAKAIKSVHFSANGYLILTGGADSTAKIWDIRTRNALQVFQGHKGTVNSAVFSPEEDKILTCSADSTARIWDTKSQKDLFTLKGFKGKLRNGGFSKDGKTLFTTSQDNVVKLWSSDSATELSPIEGHSSWVYTAAYSPISSTLLTGGSDDKSIKIWDVTSGALNKTIDGHSSWITAANFSQKGDQFLTGSLDRTVKIWDAKSFQELGTLNGHKKVIWAAKFSPDGSQILTGSDDRTARLWDRQSTKTIHTLKGHTHWVNSVDFSPDGSKLITGSEDGSIKIWNTKTGKVIATLFILGLSDWAVTTPDGLFDASQNAMRLMYYVKELEVIELEQLKFNWEPGLLSKVMGHNPEEKKQAISLDQLAWFPKIKAQIEQHTLKITLEERTGGLGKVSVWINGKMILKDANPNRQATLKPINLLNYQSYFLEDYVNTISIRSYDKNDQFYSSPIELPYPTHLVKSKGGGLLKISKKQKGKVNLYALIIGTSAYSNENLRLQFADQDAIAIAQAIRESGAALWGADKVTVKLLTTDPQNRDLPANKENIEKVLREFKSKAKARDILIVYLSGHGKAYEVPNTKEPDFYYITKDLTSMQDLSNEQARNTHALSSSHLTDLINEVPALYQILIIDACNSGQAVKNLVSGKKAAPANQTRAIDRMQDRTGMNVIVGSAADKVSFEASEFGQGLLTYSLLEGMSGPALREDQSIKFVDVARLFNYAANKVNEYAEDIGQNQQPQVLTGAGFDFGIVDANVNIPLNKKKVVFIKSNFINLQRNRDDLKLSQQLNAYFQGATAKGTGAKYHYVDVSEYKNAYSISGIYNVKAEQITVNGSLFKGEQEVGNFQVEGNKNKLDDIIDQILEKVNQIANAKS